MAGLLVYAAIPEGTRVQMEVPDALCTGVGKTAAAMALAPRLATALPEPDFVLSFGVCGASVRSGLEVGDLCLVAEDGFGDEGVQTPNGFTDLSEMRLGDVGPWPSDASLIQDVVARVGDLPLVRGVTVSTCSGTDAAADTMWARTGADVETMEGAAIAQVCAAHKIPWVQLRCVSNYTGDRDQAQWDLRLACDRVQEAVLKIHDGGLR